MPSIILVQGKSGTGKSTSLETLPPEETVMFSPNGKPLPFPGSRTKYVEGTNQFTTSSLVQLKSLIELLGTKRPNTKYVVIDDFTHYFNARMMDASFTASKDWGKWNVFAADVFAIIKKAAEALPETVEAVIIMHHTSLNDDGVQSFKSSGKLLEQTIDVVSYFTYVLHSLVLSKENGEADYKFLTNFDGSHEAKTPKDCFPERFVDNDMMDVLKTIKTYETGEAVATYETNEA